MMRDNRNDAYMERPEPRRKINPILRRYVRLHGGPKCGQRAIVDDKTTALIFSVNGETIIYVAKAGPSIFDWYFVPA